MRDTIRSRVDANLARVDNLVAIYETALAGAGQGRRGHAKTDVLRAAVVLLHATLEDCLRSIAYWRLPLAGQDVLDKIPLCTAAPAIKFSLGALTVHRGKTIDEVLGASVSAYLERSNYNNCDEVSALLSSVGVDPQQVNGQFALVTEIMERRHQIVHRADRQEAQGRGNHTVRSIGRAKVRSWIAATRTFLNAVLDRVPA